MQTLSSRCIRVPFAKTLIARTHSHGSDARKFHRDRWFFDCQHRSRLLIFEEYDHHLRRCCRRYGWQTASTSRFSGDSHSKSHISNGFWELLLSSLPPYPTIRRCDGLHKGLSGCSDSLASRRFCLASSLVTFYTLNKRPRKNANRLSGP